MSSGVCSGSSSAENSGVSTGEGPGRVLAGSWRILGVKVLGVLGGSWECPGSVLDDPGGILEGPGRVLSPGSWEGSES